MPYKDKEKEREAKRKYDEKRAGTRTRNYATVVYPESAPEDWKERLEQMFIPCLISPFHDKDVNPTGEPKKPHYHVLLAFEGVKTKAQAQEVFDVIGGVGCEVVNSVRGYARYLCHLDNPEKVRYAESQVIQYGGLDYYEIIGLASDKHKAIREMIEYCKDTGVIEYADLLEYAMCEREDWFRVLCDCGTFTMQNYLKSRRHKLVANA